MLDRIAGYLICFIITTIPLIFGAVHPIVISVYVFIILVGLGGWLLFQKELSFFRLFNFWSIAPLILILYLIFQTIPLPLTWVELLSPARAERIRMVNELAGADLQFVPLAENSPIGFYRSFIFIALLIYYHSLSLIMEKNKNMLKVILFCLIAVGAIEALYGLLQFVKPQIGILWLKLKAREAHGSIIYKNQYASLLNMIWPLAVAGTAAYFSGLSKRRTLLYFTRAQSVYLAAAIVMMVLATLFSLSRGGILTMVLVAVFLTVSFPYSYKRKTLFLVVALLLVGSYGAMLGLDTLVSRFDTIDRSGAARMAIYMNSLPMLADHWLTGIGLGAYTQLSPIYLKGFPENIHYHRAHSEYLELMIELGIPMALLVFAWIGCGILKLSSTLVFSKSSLKKDKNLQLVGIAALCGLLGFLVHGLFDFGWRLPANLIYAVTLIAVSISCLREEKTGYN